MKKALRAAIILPILLAPLYASAAFSFNFSFGSGPSCTNAVCYIGAMVIDLINGVLVPVIFAIAFIMFLWGIAKSYIIHGDDEGERSKGHQLILWGVIGFAVMISLWGLVNVVATTFGLNQGPGSVAPQYPTSY